VPVHPNRIRQVNAALEVNASGPVVYWMNRDKRLHDNWAVLFAQQLALQHQAPFHIILCLPTHKNSFTARTFDFMLGGFPELIDDCAKLGIVCKVLLGSPAKNVFEYVSNIHARCLVTDFDPLIDSQQIVHELSKHLTVPFFEVDAHNVVPVWQASNKQEFGAYTIRRKITSQLETYLVDFPAVVPMPEQIGAGHEQGEHGEQGERVDLTAVKKAISVDATVAAISWCLPGQMAAMHALNQFADGIHRYADRNNPTLRGQSDLSPYLHHGQISAQRIALKMLSVESAENSVHVRSFLEELIVRKELSDNFTYYNANYSSTDGFPAWAQQTLHEHRGDVREFVYELADWENATTHDDLWNAAQTQLVITGKMHGYMRMYWAKKILEWTESPEVALAVGIYLNDKYSIDGIDPNGYTGLAWSIGGVHDRAWAERKVYGKIRYMNANGAARKFDAKSYITTYAKT